MEQAIRDRNAARTYSAMEQALKKLVTIDGDVLYWVKEWVATRELTSKIKFFGAPFEADAQMVELEKSGIVDGIITDDGQSYVYCYI